MQISSLTVNLLSEQSWTVKLQLLFSHGTELGSSTEEKQKPYTDFSESEEEAEEAAVALSEAESESNSQTPGLVNENPRECNIT